MRREGKGAQKLSRCRACVSLFGQALIYIISGSINTYGSCGIYYVSYLRRFDSSLTYTTFLIPNTFYPIITSLTNLVSVKYG